MIEAHLRTKIQPCFDKMGILLSSIQPNYITLCALLCGCACGCTIAYKYRFLALVFLWLSGLCDVMDGTVARLFDKAKKSGAYIDLITDRMVESAIILGFTLAYPQYYFAYILFLIALLFHFSTFVAAGALVANTGYKSMHHDYSFVERAEAFLVFSLMLLMPDYLFYSLMCFNVVIFIDAFNRFFRILYTSTV